MISTRPKPATNKSDASRKIGGEVKQAADTFTLDLLDKPKRGRPRKPDALTAAERARRYRAANKADPFRATRNAQPWYLAYIEEQKRLDEAKAAEARRQASADVEWNPEMMAAIRRRQGGSA